MPLSCSLSGVCFLVVAVGSLIFRGHAIQSPTEASNSAPSKPITVNATSTSLVSLVTSSTAELDAHSGMRIVLAHALSSHALTDIYIVASGDVMAQYGNFTLPIWRSYAKKRGYGLHIVKNNEICAPYMNLSEYSSWSRANWAKVCLARQLASAAPGQENLSVYDLDTALDIQSRLDVAKSQVRAERNGSSWIMNRLAHLMKLQQSKPELERPPESLTESYVVIVDADVLVQSPNFDILQATQKDFSEADVLMLEDRLFEDDYPGCFRNGPPQLNGWEEGVCLPQGSFIMFKRGKLATDFAQQWINDGSTGPCALRARKGKYPEQDTLKECTIPVVWKRSPKTLRVANGYKGILKNTPDAKFPGLVHFPLDLKSQIPFFANLAQLNFEDHVPASGWWNSFWESLAFSLSN